MNDEAFSQPSGAENKPRDVKIDVDKIAEDINKTNIEHHNHYRRVRDLLKVIYLCPMDEEIKMIMRLNIWGSFPDKFEPWPIELIARKIGMTQDEVKRTIEAGKQNCEIFLQQKRDKDIYESFRRQEATIKNEMFAKYPYQKRRFSA